MTELKSEHVYAVEWWKNRHAQGYFPKMIQHLNWKIYTVEELWLKKHVSLNNSMRCLEIGCGYGQWMVPLSILVAEVCGFDIHPHLVHVANKKFAEHNTNNCQMKLGNGYDIPDFGGKFDLIYSISVFQHMPRAAVTRYLNQASKLIANKGLGYFHFRYATPGYADGPYSQDIEVNHAGDWSVGWTEDEVISAALSNGWKNAEAVLSGMSLFLRCSNE